MRGKCRRCDPPSRLRLDRARIIARKAQRELRQFVPPVPANQTLDRRIQLQSATRLLAKNTVLGHPRFAAQIAEMLQRRVTCGKAGRPVKESKEHRKLPGKGGAF